LGKFHILCHIIRIYPPGPTHTHVLQQWYQSKHTGKRKQTSALISNCD